MSPSSWTHPGARYHACGPAREPAPGDVLPLAVCRWRTDDPCALIVTDAPAWRPVSWKRPPVAAGKHLLTIQCADYKACQGLHITKCGGLSASSKTQFPFLAGKPQTRMTASDPSPFGTSSDGRNSLAGWPKISHRVSATSRARAPAAVETPGFVEPYAKVALEPMKESCHRPRLITDSSRRWSDWHADCFSQPTDPRDRGPFLRARLARPRRDGRRFLPREEPGPVSKQPTPMSLDDVNNAYRQGTRRWSGCDWPTTLGHCRLDVNGLASAHATLMARATAGRESTDWRAAARWLKEVEEAARQAEIEAKLAVHLATSGQVPEALRHAQRAVEVAGVYQRAGVWEPLRAAIADLLIICRQEEQPDDRCQSRTDPVGTARAPRATVG